MPSPNVAASAICAVDGKPPPPAWDAIAGVYKTGDGRFVRLHTNFPHHRDAVCKVLNCKPEREQVQAALMSGRPRISRPRPMPAAASSR